MRGRREMRVIKYEREGEEEGKGRGGGKCMEKELVGAASR